MRIIKIKNLQAFADSYCGQQIESGAYYQIQTEAELLQFAADQKVANHHSNDPQKILINNGETDLSYAEGKAWLEGTYVADVHVVETSPFAQPLYRTKDDATDSIATVPPNGSVNIDYKLLTEKYVSGGNIIIENAQMGDYIEASVYDVDSVIPVDYRTVLCEDWPVVAKYVEKMWINPNCKNEVDTRPLNAKITANLYLRIKYVATAVGSDRKVGVNYNLTKKL